MFKTIITSGLLAFMCSTLVAQNHFTRAAGSWEDDNIWGATTSGSGASWASRTIITNDVIHIDDDITLDSDLTIANDVTIVLDAQFNIEKKLRLTENSVIDFTENGSLIGVGPGNSEKISFGGDFVWSGNDGDIFGPGKMDKNFNGTLPVTLISFDLALNNETILVSWKTATEENNDYFVIERSDDGKMYEELGRVEGAGNSQVIEYYTYIDDQPGYGAIYYRLTQVDYDGTSETFAPKLIHRTSIVDMEVFPNPAKKGERTKIVTGAKDDEKIAFGIYSVNGSLLCQQEAFSVNGTIEVENKLEPGVYLVKLSSGNTNYVKRLLVK